ncbi:MAG: NADH-quinone oxidoreductase subunit K [Candidatus Wallbacteria bacterium]|nr:NADH-quinone oxidoreductase subunit K [Candidatus Wallbacteria bacterium]
MSDLSLMFWPFSIFILLIFITGIYCVLATMNLIRALIGLEILIKAVTLSLILAGYITGKTALTQSLVISLIMIEVVVAVVAGGIILHVFWHNDNISSNSLRTLKG